jgi:hypothetical protein
MDAVPDAVVVPTDREVMTWGDLGVAARHLAEAVVADGYRADIVLAIARWASRTRAP